MKTPQYGFSLDEERYHGFHDSREEAVIAAFEYDPDAKECFTGEIEVPIPENCLSADTLIEDIQCQDEFSGEWAQDWPNNTEDQLKELEENLQKVFGEWLDKHDLRPKFYNISRGSVVSHQRPEDLK